MKIVFMGTPDFALPALQSLYQKHEVVCVYTKAPKIAGRGKKEQKSPVHLWAESKGIEVRFPKTFRDEEEQELFKNINAELAVVCAYGLILPKKILEALPLGCINIHGSILPRWRGAAPIARAIEAGDKTSGITTMQMNEGLDTGDMLLKKEFDITNLSAGEVHDRLAQIGADLIIDTLDNLAQIIPQKQDDSLANYAQKIDKSEMLLDFSLDSTTIFNKIRAFSPFPCMYFEYDGERFKVLQAEIIDYIKAPLLFKCGDGKGLRVVEIQRQGKKPMSAEELLRGLKIEI